MPSHHSHQKASVLLADLDTGFASSLASHLSSAIGVRAAVCPDPQQLPSRLAAASPDVLIVSCDRPGFTPVTCQRLRQTFRGWLLILVDSRDEDTKVGCLDGGADLCLNKASSPRLIATSVKALLRRDRHPSEGAESPERIRYVRRKSGSRRHIRLELDPENHQACIGRRWVRLTASEFALLEHLVVQSGRTVTREELCKAVRGIRLKKDDRTVDVLVVRLRKKIGEVYTARPLIKTVPNVGYELVN